MKIGILGGTFDPIHKAHVAMGFCALRQFKLDQVLFVLSARPPHKRSKRPLASIRHRSAMMKLALKRFKKMYFSDIEIKRRGLSYTIDTIHYLKKQFSSVKLYLILGQDSYENLAQWRCPDTIMKSVHFLVAKRPGNHAKKIAGTRTSWLRMSLSPLSSSGIRKDSPSVAKLGTALVPGVVRYIRDHHLYGCHS